MQHNGVKPPPGSVISSFGIRKYYTLDTPIGKKDLPSKTESTQGPLARAETWPLNEPEGQQKGQARQQPAHKPTTNVKATPQAKQELATQTEPLAQRAVNQTQTDPVASRWSNERVPVDAATSPITLPHVPREVVFPSSGSEEEYRRVLSRHSDDLWDARKSMSIAFSDDEVGSLPTPYPPKKEHRTKHVGVMTDQNGVEERKGTVEKTTQATQVTLPTTKYIHAAAPRTRRHVQLVRRHQPQPLPPLYIVQPSVDDSESDDESIHHPNYPQFPVYPLNANYPYPYNNMGHQHLPHINPIRSEDHVTEHAGSQRMQLVLEYGVIANTLGFSVLPVAVQEELFKEYGHIKSTEVTIIKHNGNFSIHSHRVRSSQD